MFRDVTAGGANALLAGTVVSGGGRVSAILSGRLAPVTMIEASRERARRRPSVATGLCPSGPPGLARDAGVDAPCCGGIDPDPVADAGQGMKGEPFLSSFHGWRSMMWMDDGG